MICFLCGGGCFVTPTITVCMCCGVIFITFIKTKATKIYIISNKK